MSNKNIKENFLIRKTEGEDRYSIDVYKSGNLVEKGLHKGLKIEREEQEIKDALTRAELNNELTRENVLDCLLEELGIYEEREEFEDGLNFDDEYEEEDHKKIKASEILNKDWKEIVLIDIAGGYFDVQDEVEALVDKNLKKESGDIYSLKFKGLCYLCKREDFNDKQIKLLNGKMYDKGGTFMNGGSIMNKVYGKSKFMNKDIELILKEHDGESEPTEEEYLLENYFTHGGFEKDFKYFIIKGARLNGKEYEFRTFLGEYIC